MKSNSYIDISKLKFDPENPRLPSKYNGMKDEMEIIDYMLRYGNIVELMKSIGETGYSDAEPLLVTKNNEGTYIVIEGNRRLAALKLLNNPDLAKVKKKSIIEVLNEVKATPKEVPVIVYQERDDVLDYLGYRHITGVKDWGSLEKARYLKQLYERHIGQNSKDIYRILAKMIGSRSDYVEKLICALFLYDEANDEAYYGSKINEEDISFSFLTTALGYSAIIDYIELTKELSYNKEKFEDIFTWLFNEDKKVISDSRQIKELAKVLTVDVAVERLKNTGNLDEAVLYTNGPSEAFLDMLKKAKLNLRSAKEGLENLSSFPQEANDLLNDLEKLIKSINGALKENFSESSTSEIPEDIKKLFEEFMESRGKE